MSDYHDPRAGFFVWCYYPVEKHTRESCERFCHAMLREVDDLDDGVKSKADALFRTGSGTFSLLDIPGPTPSQRWPRMTLSIKRVATCEDFGSDDCDVSSVRPESHTVLLIGDKRFTRPSNDVSMAAFMNTIMEFASTFSLTFGFGCKEFNRWSRSRGSMPPPESRLWPLNIYDLASYDEVLTDRLLAFANNGSSEWSLSISRGRYAVLKLKSVDIPWMEIKGSDSQAVLGSGDDLLVPTAECGLYVKGLCKKSTYDRVA